MEDEMQMRRCPRCGETHPAKPQHFYRNRSQSLGLSHYCKQCDRQNKAECSRRHPGRMRAANRKHYWQDPHHHRLRVQRYVAANREQVNAQKRAAYAADPETHRQRSRAWAKAHPEWNRQKARAYRAANRLAKGMSDSVYRALRAGKNGFHWEDLVPYTLDELRGHLEAQFAAGMTWDNYGKWIVGGPLKWNIDHIRPVASFTFETPDDPEFQTCFSLTNLQPLWGPDNQTKGAKWDGQAKLF